MKTAASSTAVALMCALSLGAWAQTEDKLRVGDKAPDFVIPEGVATDEIGDARKLSDLEGRRVVLAFYPKAFTPGCTKQMCGYRDNFSQFVDTETIVLAISMDEQSEGDRFKQHHGLPFPVIGDPHREIVKRYGVPVQSRGSIEYAKRVTFLIDDEGVIQYIDWEYNWANGDKPLFTKMRELVESFGVAPQSSEEGAPEK